MVTAEKVATSGISGKLREVLHVCENEGEALPTTIVDVIKLAHEGIEMKRKNTTMPSQQTDTGTELLDIRADGRTMNSQITAAEELAIALKTLLADAQMALDKPTDESARTEANLRAEMVAVGKSLEAEKALVKSLKRKLATEIGKNNSYLSSVDRQVRSLVAS